MFFMQLKYVIPKAVKSKKIFIFFYLSNNSVIWSLINARQAATLDGAWTTHFFYKSQLANVF